MASSKRERELARQRAARQAARRAERERRRRQRTAVLASVLAVLLVGGAAVATTVATQSDDTASAEPTPTPTPAEEPTPSAEPVQAGDCTYAPSNSASNEPARPVELPGPEVDEQTPFTAVVATDQGELTLELLTADAPCTVHSFRSLAAQGFFDDSPCHRLTDRGIFVLQCGDPSGSGRGGPGYSFADENLTGATYERGVVAMANSGPDTNGSQFFLVYDDSTLPPQYTPFGRLTEEGLETLDAIAEAGALEPDETGNTAPVTPVQIEQVTVEPS